MLVAIFVAAAGCSGSDYRRGTTSYGAGKADVKQPNIRHTAKRSFEGFRVAGPDSDIEPEYWYGELIAKGRLATFELFEQRYRDLEVYQTKACDPILKSFRTWARRRNLQTEFDSFWNNR